LSPPFFAAVVVPSPWRVFAWEDTFRRLLLRFERISDVHYALKTLAYTMINLEALPPQLIAALRAPVVTSPGHGAVAALAHTNPITSPSSSSLRRANLAPLGTSCIIRSFGG
jgi:hypothetical protein